MSPVPRFHPEFAALSKAWHDCTRCPIGMYAFRHVFGDGAIPAKFLFVGEGPGVSEDALGIPFVGPSGRLLREAMTIAGFRQGDWFLTNLVACRPTEEPGGKNRPPNAAEQAQCFDRLAETVRIVRPRRVVAVGRVATEALIEKLSSYHLTSVHHPAYILRQGGAKSHDYNAWVKELRKIKEQTK